MKQNNMLAMILAGGRGSRLHDLTNKVAKPAVSYGGKYRIIDFPLSNCANSGIDVVGVLTQYESVLLNSYVAAGGRWGLDAKDSGVYVLPPREKADANLDVYRGTADAISQNIDFIDNYDPEYVVILSGDHLYKMDYNEMLEFHKERNADLTVSVIPVPWEEASRFGVMSVDDDKNITRFAEKPKEPESNLASMGLYIFNWDVLRRALEEDHVIADSDHDFGKNLIPKLLGEGKKLCAYTFRGYWQDVGTIDSYYSSQMALLEENPEFDIFEDNMRIFSNSNVEPPHYAGENAVISGSLVCNGCIILGTVKHSILSPGVYVGADALVEDSILLPNVRVEAGARVFQAIAGEGAVVEAGACFAGGNAKEKIALIGDSEHFKSL